MRQYNLGRYFLLGLGVILFIAGRPAWSETSLWPPSPSRLSFATTLGSLNIHMNEYIYESELRIDNVPVTPNIKGLLNIPYAFDLPNSQAALVSISDGSATCPFVYRWILVNNKGYKVSAPFGSCSELITASVNGKKFSMQTPNHQNPDKIDTYVYDGKTITRRIKPKVTLKDPS